MSNLLYALYSLMWVVMGTIEEATKDTFTGILKFANRPVSSEWIDGLEMLFDLDSNGQAFMPEGDDPGTTIDLSPAMVKVSNAGGFVSWLKARKEIPCTCGGNESCPRCNGTNVAYDRYAIKQPKLDLETERTTLIAILLDQVRVAIKTKGYKYMVFVPKGNGTMYLCTLSALEELVGDTSDGKGLKRAGYFAGYSLYENLSESKEVRVAILKEEEWLNGQLMWNVQMGLNLDAHAIRLLGSSIIKGSARTICRRELQFGKKLFGITSRVCGIGTHELIKRVDKAHIVEDCGHYYVIQFDLKDLVIVNPPLNQGLPGLGLSLWKYGGYGKMLNSLVTGGFFQKEAIRNLTRAMSGSYLHQSRVLNTRLPKIGESTYIGDFSFPIPTVKDGEFEWRNPSDEKSWKDMWRRFHRYLYDNILRVLIPGLKAVVASCSIVLDAYQEAFDLNWKGERKVFTILPDVYVRTEGRKVSMEEAIMDKDKGFMLGKDPMSSIRHLVTITPLGTKSLLVFLLTGQVILYEDDEPVLCGAGCVIVPSKLMQEIMCIQDFDGDQPKIYWVDRQYLTPVPEPVDWVKEFVTHDESSKVNLKSEQEKLEYYSDLMMTVIAARQAIGAMVLGALSGYIELIVRASNDKRLDSFPLSGWDNIQRLLSAIAEIYAIKKEKSMAHLASKKEGWLWVDMALDLFNEAKDMIPLFRESTKAERKLANAIRGIIRPFGEMLVENDAGEPIKIKTFEPYHVLRTLVKNAKMVEHVPEGIRDYFPSINLIRNLAETEIVSRTAQSIKTDAEHIHEISSDVQIQRAIFKKMLDLYLSENRISRMSGLFIELDKLAKDFIEEVREGNAEVEFEFPEGYDGPEKTEMRQLNRAVSNQKMVDAGLCEVDESRPWVVSKGLDPDKEFLFAALVGIRDMQYTSSKEGDFGGIKRRDGRKTSFNRCTPEGIRRCILGFFATCAVLTVHDITGNGDETPLKHVTGFRYPVWVKEDVVEFEPSEHEEEVIL